MFLWQAMIMKLLYYDQLLYTKWYGQEVYYYKKNKKTYGLSFWFQEEKKNENRIHSNTMFTFFQSPLLKPTAIMYLYRNLLIAKNCMVDGRLHEFCLSNCGSTIIQLHRFKKETLAFICTKASCKALFRSCRETCPLLDFLKSTLALTSSLRRRWVSVPHSASVCDFQVVLARLWMWARTLRASFSNFISILGLKRSFKWHFAHSYLSLDCSDTVLWETCPSCLSRACAAHPPLYYIGFTAFLFAKGLDIGLLSACWGGTKQDQMLGCCVPHSPKVIVDEKILFVLEVWWLWVGLVCQECTFNR